MLLLKKVCQKDEQAGILTVLLTHFKNFRFHEANTAVFTPEFYLFLIQLPVFCSRSGST